MDTTASTQHLMLRTQLASIFRTSCSSSYPTKYSNPKSRHSTTPRKHLKVSRRKHNMHPATERAMSPYAKKPKAGMPQIIGGTTLQESDGGGLVDTAKQVVKDLWNRIVPDTSTLSHKQDDASKVIQENMN